MVKNMPMEPAWGQILILLLICYVHWLTHLSGNRNYSRYFQQGDYNTGICYPGSRRFKKPKGVLSSLKDQQKQEDITIVNMKIQYIDCVAGAQESGSKTRLSDFWGPWAEGLSGESWSHTGYTTTDRDAVKIDRSKGRNTLVCSFLLPSVHLLL